MGTEKIIVNKMLINGTDKRVYSINLTSGGVINGLIPDGRSMITRAREECSQYKNMYGIQMPGSVLADRMAMRFQMSTIYASYRPIGTSLILANHDNMKGYQLYMAEPSGACFQYYGCASGRGKQMARNEIEKGKFKDMTCEEAIPKIAKILLQCQEEMKEKKQELEISFISDSSDKKHKILNRAQMDAVMAEA
jgi:20S proteasome subunit alpha 7